VKKENGEEKLVVEHEAEMIHTYPLFPEIFQQKAVKALMQVSKFIKDSTTPSD